MVSPLTINHTIYNEVKFKWKNIRESLENFIKESGNGSVIEKKDPLTLNTRDRKN